MYLFKNAALFICQIEFLTIIRKTKNEQKRRIIVKKIISLLIVTLLVFVPAFSGQIYADSLDYPEQEPIDEEIIEHFKDEVFYTNCTATTHEVWTREILINTVTGALIATNNVTYLRTESHHFSPLSYNMNNYHSGSKHYFQYSKYCYECNYTCSEWHSGYCPGNGHCIAPMSIGPLSE